MAGQIHKVAVLGSGVMGGGIAAHVANAGLEVVLLDIVPKGATNRNQVSDGAIQRLLKANPAAFMHPRNAMDSINSFAKANKCAEKSRRRPGVTHEDFERFCLRPHLVVH